MEKAIRFFFALVMLPVLIWVVYFFVTQQISGVAKQLSDSQQAKINQRELIKQEQQAQFERQNIVNAEALRKEQEFEGAFYASYRAPKNCDDWQSKAHMVECTNHQMRAKAAFREVFFPKQSNDASPSYEQILLK